MSETLKILPCRKCGSSPVWKMAENVFAYRHGDMMVGNTTRMLVCPKCDVDTAANEWMVKDDENRKSSKQIELWNMEQERENTIKEKLEKYVICLNELCEKEKGLVIECKHIRRSLRNFKKFVLLEKSLHTMECYTTSTREVFWVGSIVPNKVDVTYGIGIISEENELIPLFDTKNDVSLEIPKPYSEFNIYRLYENALAPSVGVQPYLKELLVKITKEQ